MYADMSWNDSIVFLNKNGAASQSRLARTGFSPTVIIFSPTGIIVSPTGIIVSPTGIIDIIFTNIH
jgi:hypothetical protein